MPKSIGQQTIRIGTVLFHRLNSIQATVIGLDEKHVHVKYDKPLENTIEGKYRYSDIGIQLFFNEEEVSSDIYENNLSAKVKKDLEEEKLRKEEGERKRKLREKEVRERREAEEKARKERQAKAEFEKKTKEANHQRGQYEIRDLYKSKDYNGVIFYWESEERDNFNEWDYYFCMKTLYELNRYKDCLECYQYCKRNSPDFNKLDSIMELVLSHESFSDEEGRVFTGLMKYPLDLPQIVTETVLKILNVSSLSEIDYQRRLRMSFQGRTLYDPDRVEVADYSVSSDTYLLTYFPLNYYKIWKPLGVLELEHKLPLQCKVLELGAGPGTATLGLISFYSKRAEENPEENYCLDITAVERETSFSSMFYELTSAIINTCPSNLNIRIQLVQQDAFLFEVENPNSYELIIESYMLNSYEGRKLEEQEEIVNVIVKAMNNDAFFIMIEPANSYEIICRIAQKAKDKGMGLYKESSYESIPIENISLYQETLSAKLRWKDIQVHSFSYGILKRSIRDDTECQQKNRHTRILSRMVYEPGS